MCHDLHCLDAWNGWHEYQPGWGGGVYHHLLDVNNAAIHLAPALVSLAQTFFPIATLFFGGGGME